MNWVREGFFGGGEPHPLCGGAPLSWNGVSLWPFFPHRPPPPNYMFTTFTPALLCSRLREPSRGPHSSARKSGGRRRTTKSNNNNIPTARVADAPHLVGEAGGLRPGSTTLKRIAPTVLLSDPLIPHPQPLLSFRMQAED